MNNRVELPTCIPMYTTFNFQGTASIVSAANKSLKNWFYNNSMMLRCNRIFLRGHTTPEVVVTHTDVFLVDEIEKIELSVRFMKDGIHKVIKNMLNDGYYVSFEDFDDYYIKGKSFYQKRHIAHDGLICGYDNDEKTYSIAAYNTDLIYCVFKTPQICIEHAMMSMIENNNVYGSLMALKANQNEVKLDIGYIKMKIEEYLGYDMEKCPPVPEGEALGLVVHDYIGMYIDCLLNDSIPYERTDWRVFRMLWEHKECMLERIRAVENELDSVSEISDEYKPVVRECNMMRAMYAKYCFKQDKDILLMIKKKLDFVKTREKELLERFVIKIGEVI